ncbi:hypothetical protein SAMN05421803_10430 [Nocardiopsis flavescens]|uniref:Uncharacterized protein n=1 Tax=Nocardiopsis flavescens TaxID=758803 RepID=A0A1M6H4I9_9ACTN|nr:movement TGBp3 family protein [Nocardiopsis flavescens]SHJ17056.1 hypothetical protein SAMN05421803_10430 [Nocardiopsis flavescens]
MRVPRDESLVSIGFEEDTTEEEADRYTRDLVLFLERLDVEEVRAAAGDEVPGTRSADPAALAGAVVVAGLLLKPVLSALVSLAGTWLEQSGQRSVTVEVDGNRVTVRGRVDPADVEAYVKALRPGGGARPAGEGLPAGDTRTAGAEGTGA